MRLHRLLIACTAATLIGASFVSSAATAAIYTAKQIPPGTQLRNNNGVLVSTQISNGGTPTQRTTTVVSFEGNTIAVYFSPVGKPDKLFAINDSNVGVGSRIQSLNAGVNLSHAAIYANSVFTDIHATIAAAFGLDSASTSSTALDINNAGEIVGSIVTSTTSYPFHYKNGVVTNLRAKTGAPLDTADAINNFGQITGMMGYPDYAAYVYSPASGVRTLNHSDATVKEIGKLINDAGQVIGSLRFPSTPPAQSVHAFLYEGTAVKDIGLASADITTPYGINNAGTVVGDYLVGSDISAFVYRDGVIQPLTELVDSASLNGRTIKQAISVNDDGGILAYASDGQMMLLQPASQQIDPAVFNFEASTQGWESSGEPIITVSNSTSHVYSGGRSLGIHFNEAGFASVRAMNPSVLPGHTITFHIYIPADSKIEWIQPYALSGGEDGWAWYGNWKPIEALQLGAWNSITVSIPSSMHTVDSIGVEFFTAESGAGDVFVDSVDYGVTPDTAQYNFETGTQGWISDDNPNNGTLLVVSPSTAQQFAGRKSLELAVYFRGIARVSVAHPAVHAGDTITFRLFIPATMQLASVQPFAIEGAAGGWRWHGNWQPVSALQVGAWNTLTVTVPEDAQEIEALGVEIQTSDESSQTTYRGTVFVDTVSF